MNQIDIDRIAEESLRMKLKKLGLAGYMSLKKMLEDARVIGARADGKFLWKVRQKIVGEMGEAPPSLRNFKTLLHPLTDAQGKRLAQDYDLINGMPVEMLFLKAMILSFGKSDPVTVEEIPQFAHGLVQAAVHRKTRWLEDDFDFVLVPRGWLRRDKKP